MEFERGDGSRDPEESKVEHGTERVSGTSGTSGVHWQNQQNSLACNNGHDDLGNFDVNREGPNMQLLRFQLPTWSGTSTIRGSVHFRSKRNIPMAGQRKARTYIYVKTSQDDCATSTSESKRSRKSTDPCMELYLY